MAETVAVVDDEQNVRRTLTQVLESSGYQVRAYVTGEEALESSDLPEADLLLLDIALPGIDGMEVLRRLRARDVELPVVMITAYGSIESAVEAMKLGAIDYLTKPFAPARLREVVAEVLKRKTLRDAPPPAREEGAPEDPPTLLQHAKAKLEARRFDEARGLLQRASGSDDSKLAAEVLNLQGVLLEMEGDRHEALKRYRAAGDMDPTYEPAKHNLHRATSFKYDREGIDMGGREP